MQLGVEALMVVLSVLLALALNSWRDNQNNEALAAHAVRNLEREIRENREEILSLLPYHRELLDTLASEHPPYGITTRSATIQNNAWEAAQSAGIVAQLDFEIIAMASRIQETQRQYQAYDETVAAIMLRGNFGGDYEVERIPGGLLVIVSEMVGLEQKLLSQYDVALKLLER